ncbi:MAG: hypothetical protein WKG07_36320 [Hymenobacter sp.]
MKNLIRFATLLCSLLFLVLFNQCTSDRPISACVKPELVIVSAKQLAADTSFVAAVKTNRRVTKLLFNQLRLLGSNKARQQQSAEIMRLLRESGTVNHAKELAEQFEFANENDFKTITHSLFKKEVELSARYRNFKTFDKKLLQESYAQVVDKLEVQLPRTNDAIICAECPFNNCQECFGDRVGVGERVVATLVLMEQGAAVVSITVEMLVMVLECHLGTSPNYNLWQNFHWPVQELQ